MFKCFGSVRRFIEINTFIQKGNIKLIKIDSKAIYNVTKEFILECLNIYIYIY